MATLTRTTDTQSPARHTRTWTTVLAVEVVLASTAVVLDLGIPTFALLGLMAVSLLVRHEGFASLGLQRSHHRGLVWKMFAVAAGWSLVQLALVMPVANHLSGREQDLGDFADLEGNVGMLLGMLVLAWTVAAVFEELAYRGYLQTRLRQLFGSGRVALVVAVVVSSLLFGRVHSEQGLIGMLATSLDAVVFSVLRYRYRTLWAPVLAHGFNNTIGFVAFFLVGPIHGFW